MCFSTVTSQGNKVSDISIWSFFSIRIFVFYLFTFSLFFVFFVYRKYHAESSTRINIWLTFRFGTGKCGFFISLLFHLLPLACQLSDILPPTSTDEKCQARWNSKNLANYIPDVDDYKNKILSIMIKPLVFLLLSIAAIAK